MNYTYTCAWHELIAMYGARQITYAELHIMGHLLVELTFDEAMV